MISLFDSNEEKDLDTPGCIKVIQNENPEDIKAIQECEPEIRSYRKKIADEAKKNFELEHALNEIDEKIKLLINNRMKVEDVLATAHNLSKVKRRDDESGESPIQGKVTAYEDLFYLLQTQPRYFAQMARLLTTGGAPLFVKTVVFDMYGDQYDSREERLLLVMFQRAIYDEIQNTTDKGSLFRANTAITQMLSSYAKRGSGLAILKELFQEPLVKLTSNSKLNLEIAPRFVYSEIINLYESKTGEVSPLPKQVDDETAAANPEVQKIIAERKKLLIAETDIFLTRILDGVDKIPFGMRWICKQLGVMSKERFPDADKYKIGSLIGGNIFLRFFCPAIVTPDAINFISSKPSKIMRKNLIYIVKILQALSNGIPFGDKEQHLTVLNPYLEKYKERIQEYFENLIQVEDPEDSLQLVVDKYVEHTSAHPVYLSLNQIFLIHSLLEHNINSLAPLNKRDDACDAEHKDDIRLRDLIRQLGPAPPKLKPKEDREVVLAFMERRHKRNTTSSADGDQGQSKESARPMRAAAEQLKTTICAVLAQLSSETETEHFMAYLQEHQQAAFGEGNEELAQKISQIQKMFKILYQKKEITMKETEDETYNYFLLMLAKEVSDRRVVKEKLIKRLEMVKSAMRTIQSHHTYLESRLELYNIYLDNVRKGRGDVLETTTKKKKKKKDKKKDKKKLKLTHVELCERGLIVWTNPDIEQSFSKTLKKLIYTFTEKSPGQYRVDVTVKKGVEISIPGMNKPLEIMLEKLLQMQENNQRELKHENLVSLNVNLLINLLNSQFVAKEAARP